MRFLSILLIFFFSSSTLLSQTLEGVTAKSSVTFKIKSWGFTVDGKFEGLKVSGFWQPDDLKKSWFKASVQAKTVDANIDARNESLRGEDYFYVEKFPEIRIESKSIEQTSEGYQLIGTLQMRDVKKEISMPFTVKKIDDELIFDGEVVVERLEYGVGPSTFSLGDDARVFIHCVTKISN